MNGREKRLVIGGVFFGLLLAALLWVVAGLMRGNFKSAEARDVKNAESRVAPAPNPPVTHGAHETAVDMPSGAGGGQLNTVELTADEQRYIDVETVEVRRRQLRREVLAVGKAQEAETRLATISARVGGRIDKLFVNFTGQSVRRGQPIALIYSPEVVASAEEYKLALENKRRLGPNADPQAIAQADDLVAASRRRLELWGLISKQIEELGSSPEPKIHITVHAPAGGIITERRITEGQYVKEGDVLYALADLSTIWVIAEVYESDMSLIRVGQAAEITAEALPGKTLHGRVSFIEPIVNLQTRAVPVRIQVRNPGMRLRPGMFVNARLRTAGAQQVLSVPRSAVLQSGTRNVVYVAKGDGVFEGRELTLGPPGEDYYPVLAGLQERERVVTRGNFLIDSQTRITGGMTGLFGGSKEFARGEPQIATAPKADLKIDFRTDPDPPKGAADNTVRVSVTDPSGKPVSDAQVKVTFVMPAMPSMNMPEMRASADLTWNGAEYTGKLGVPMAGPYNVNVDVSRGGQRLASRQTRVTAK